MQTAEYYRDVLGFEIDSELTADDFIMLWVDNNQLGLMLTNVWAGPDTTAKVSTNGQIVGVMVEGIDELFARHKANGAKIVFGIVDRPWGCKEYGVEDPNGYRLYFRQSGF